MKNVMMLLLSMGIASAFALPNGPMMEKVFNQVKQMHVQGLQAKITIEQNALTCVQAAQSHDDMKACEESEHKALDNLRDSQKKQFESMRANMPGMQRMGMPQQPGGMGGMQQQPAAMPQ